MKSRSRRRAFALIAAAALLFALPAEASHRPKIIDLPAFWQPEGIVAKSERFWVGSLTDGGILKGNLRSGEHEVLVPGTEGGLSVGLALGKHRMLFAAGGSTGQGHVYHRKTGEELASYQFADAGTAFINDVIATRDAAWFTDSFSARLFKVPIDDGEPAASDEFEVLDLTGDLDVIPNQFNVNGIEARSNGKVLVIVQSNTGLLFTVDPETGVTQTIDLGGTTLPSGDGILFEGGHRLWVVQNGFNQLALVDLESDLESGELVLEVPDEDFDVPTTVARSGGRLAVANARFNADNPDGEYWITQIKRPRP